MERALSVFGQDTCLCAFRACVWLVLLARCRQALDKSDIPKRVKSPEITLPGGAIKNGGAEGNEERLNLKLNG